VNPYMWPALWFYIKGALYGLGSVATLFVTLRYFIPNTNLGRLIDFLVYSLFHDVHGPLTATSGGNPSLFGHLWFWLWSMIVFAGTFLIYLRLERA
jgi:hypothetical protein